MVTQTLTTTAKEVGSFLYVSVSPIPGEPCPTCGRKVPMTNAQRQKAYRERTKGVA